MKKEELEVMIQEAKSDGNIDYDKLAEAVNKKVNSIRDSHTEKELKKQAPNIKEQVTKDLLAKMGVETPDKVTELKTNNEVINTQNTEMTNKMSELSNKYDNLIKTSTEEKHKNIAISKGIKFNMVDYVIFTASKNTNDEKTFEEALNEVIESNKALLSQNDIKIGAKKDRKTIDEPIAHNPKLLQRHPHIAKIMK